MYAYTNEPVILWAARTLSLEDEIGLTEMAIFLRGSTQHRGCCCEDLLKVVAELAKAEVESLEMEAIAE